MTDVKCKVQTCYYWGNNDICKADSIMVDNNTASGGRGFRMEVGDLDARINTQSDDTRTDTKIKSDVQSKNQSGVQARDSHETLCSTFRPKGSEPKH